jgi:hypothetical protein
VAQEGKRKGLKVAAVLLVLVIVVILMLTPSVQSVVMEFLLSPFQERAPKYATYRMDRVLSVDANGGTLYNFTLDAPVPVSLLAEGNPIQQVSSVTSSPTGAQSLRYDVPWCVWEHGPLSGDQDYSVRITYDIRVDTHVWSIDAASSGTVGDVPIAMRSAYLHDEWKIIISDSGIKQKAKDIVGSEENVYIILQLIYDWVVANIEYPSSNQGGDPASSMETLDSLIGDCDDQSILFCALARASGVPAWLQLGALYDNSRDAWSGHGWVQAYVPLSAGGSESVCIDTVNRDFMLWMPNRLAEYTDDGNGQHLRDYYYSFTYTYDSHSYPSGQGPVYMESYTSVLHAESPEKVQVGAIQFSLVMTNVEAAVAQIREA